MRYPTNLPSLLMESESLEGELKLLNTNRRNSTLMEECHYGRKSVTTGRMTEEMPRIDDFLSFVSGLIHVGGNSGQERGTYAAHGLPVLWVEALPDAYHRLCRNISELPKQLAVQGLATDLPGQTYTFHVANNEGASSSIFEFAMHRDIWPDVAFTHDIELKSTTIDTILADSDAHYPGYNALVMDTQGSELLVLKGASETLKMINYIKSEAADFESYKGCATVDELIEYLANFGFRLVAKEAFAEHPNGGKYFELLFKKRVPAFSRLSGWIKARK
jgi:FkbM family methyltransferase